MSKKRSKKGKGLERSGSQFSVAADRLDPDTELADWFVVGLPRAEVKMMALTIVREGQVGDFLVRDVQSEPNAYGLSVKGPEGTMLSFLIVKNPSPKNPGYVIKGTSKAFPTVSSLVQYYAAKPREALGVQLRLPDDDDDDDDDAAMLGDTGIYDTRTLDGGGSSRGGGGGSSSFGGLGGFAAAPVGDDDDESSMMAPSMRFVSQTVITPPPPVAGADTATGLTDEERWAMNKKLEFAAMANVAGSVKLNDAMKRRKRGAPAGAPSELSAAPEGVAAASSDDVLSEASTAVTASSARKERRRAEKEERKHHKKKKKSKDKDKDKDRDRRRRRAEQLRQFGLAPGAPSHMFPNFASLPTEAQIEAAAMQVELLRREAELAQARLAAVQATAAALREHGRDADAGADAQVRLPAPAAGGRSARGSRGARVPAVAVAEPPSPPSPRESPEPRGTKPQWKVELERRKREREERDLLERQQRSTQDFEREQQERRQRVQEQLEAERERGLAPASHAHFKTASPAPVPADGGRQPLIVARDESAYDNMPPLNNRNAMGEFVDPSAAALESMDQERARYEARKQELMAETQRLMEEQLAEMDPDLQAIFRETQRLADEALHDGQANGSASGGAAPAKASGVRSPRRISFGGADDDDDHDGKPEPAKRPPMVVIPDSPSTPRHEPPSPDKKPVRSAMKKRPLPPAPPVASFQSPQLKLEIDIKSREGEAERLKVLEAEEMQRRARFDEEINARYKRSRSMAPKEMQLELRELATRERDELERRQV